MIYMNKPYFAKYLPVEGEIKEGDKVFHKGEILTAKSYDSWFTKWDFVEKSIPPVEYDKDCKKVKLFLCSRDIQVGDKIRNDRRGIIDAEITSFDSNGVTLTLKGGNLKYPFDTATNDECYKVIGEISNPDISKEQEFSEEEIKELDLI